MYSHGARLQLPSYGQSGERKRAQTPDRDESKSSYKQAEKNVHKIVAFFRECNVKCFFVLDEINNVMD